MVKVATGSKFVTRTKSGYKCQKWSRQWPHRHSYSSEGNHNYCRDPDNLVLIGVTLQIVTNGKKIAMRSVLKQDRATLAKNGVRHTHGRIIMAVLEITTIAAIPMVTLSIGATPHLRIKCGNIANNEVT